MRTKSFVVAAVLGVCVAGGRGQTGFDKPKLWGEWKSWIDAMKPTLKDSLWAVRDATAVNEKFPLVIYASSFSEMSGENADLCEYLASHGYVVVASTDKPGVDECAALKSTVGI